MREAGSIPQGDDLKDYLFETARTGRFAIPGKSDIPNFPQSFRDVPLQIITLRQRMQKSAQFGFELR